MSTAGTDIQKDGTLGDAPAAPVTAQTKFRRGGFRSSAEVIAEEAAVALPSGAPAAPAAAEETDEVMNAAIAADPNIGFELSEGVTMEGMETPEPQPPAVTAAQQAEKIRIGSREFNSVAEATAYAEELERQRDADEAFRQGLDAGRSNPSTPAQAAEVTPEDPQLARYREIVRQEMTAKESRESTWLKFYQDYPDLAHSRDLVSMVFDREYPQLQNTEVNAALKKIAEKARGMLKPYAEATIPKVTLPRVPAAAVPGSGNPGIRTPQPQKQALNFTQQLKQARRGKAVR